MRFDYFLANLLFGMTLLTAFMSAAHLLGDFAVARARLTRKASVALRVMILIACSLSALIMFLSKLSGTNINQTIFSDSAVVEPRLALHGGIEFRQEKSNSPRHMALDLTDDEHSWTLYNVFTEESQSELRSQTEIVKTAGTLYSLVNSNSPADCVAWRERAVTLGFKVSNVSSLPSAKIRPFVLACASESMTSEHLVGIRDLIAEGGSVFFVGKVRGENSAITSQLLLTKSFRQPENMESAAVVVGGSFFSFGGLPSGIRIDFGPGWLNSPGSGFAEVDGDGRDLSLAQYVGAPGTVYSAMIFRQFGQGRVAWTSLPARLGEQLNTLYGPYWNIVTARFFSRLAGIPILGIDNVPGDSSSLVIPTIHAQYKFKNARALEPILRNFNAFSSFYLVMSEVLADHGTFQTLINSKNELGASDIDHNPPTQELFFESSLRYSNWRNRFTTIASDSSAFVPDYVPGAIIPVGLYMGAPSYAALLANRYAYALGDPFNDWITPYSVMMERTSVLRRRALEHQSVRGNTISNDLAILPMASGDDFQFVGTSEHIAINQVLSRITKNYENATRLGGPYVMTMHTQILGSEDGRRVVKSALESFVADKAKFMSVRSFLKWWKAKSSLSFKTKMISSKELTLHLANVGSTTAENFTLHAVLEDGWQIDQNGKNDSIMQTREGVRLQVKEIAPGKSMDWVLRKRTEDSR